MSVEVKRVFIYIGLFLWSAIWMFVAAYYADETARLRWKLRRFRQLTEGR
ncbi:MAG TPA: hypothetical protein GX506_00360 [Firmicutes bacterium]|nr:hypothetical protein [Bacillota bacterium]